jgi:hypothetical protein
MNLYEANSQLAQDEGMLEQATIAREGARTRLGHFVAGIRVAYLSLLTEESTEAVEAAEYDAIHIPEQLSDELQTEIPIEA